MGKKTALVDPNETAVPDITVPWIYESHGVTLLVLTVILVLYFAFAYETDSVQDNLWNGIYCCTFVYLAIGCLVFPAGPYIRPHPIFWRIIFSISLAYKKKRQTPKKLKNSKNHTYKLVFSILYCSMFISFSNTYGYSISITCIRSIIRYKTIR